MDDGSKLGKGAKIATNNFTKEEISFLSVLLADKFNLKTTVHSAGKDKGHTLYIHKKSMSTFIDIVKPHMIQSMHYKLYK